MFKSLGEGDGDASYKKWYAFLKYSAQGPITLRFNPLLTEKGCGKSEIFYWQFTIILLLSSLADSTNKWNTLRI